MHANQCECLQTNLECVQATLECLQTTIECLQTNVACVQRPGGATQNVGCADLTKILILGALLPRCFVFWVQALEVQLNRRDTYQPPKGASFIDET